MGQIISGQRRVTLDQVRARGRRAASALRDLGVGPGDSIALMMRNDLPFFEAS